MAPLAFLQRPARWLKEISHWRATMSGGPAFAFELALKAADDALLETLDLTAWRRAFCGAEPVPEALLKRFRERLAPAGLFDESVFACYGLAEVTLFIAGHPSVAPCPLPAGSRDLIRIVDAETRRPVCEDGQSGEIWISSPSVASGYFGNA